MFRDGIGEVAMKTAIRAMGLTVGLVLSAMPAFAAEKACEDLKTEIGTKLQSKGVTSFSLEIVPTDARNSGKVIGDCERGTKKITYKKVRLISS